MATGKEVAEFSAKFTSFTFSPGPHGSTLIQGNAEGSATGGLGTVLGTGTFVVGGGKSGTYTWCGISYLEDGAQLASDAVGAYENIGKHRWQTHSPVVHLSDGRTLVFESEVNLAERSWTGKLFERT